MPAFHLIEQARIVEALAPAADAGGRSGTWVSLKGRSRCFIKVHITQGNAATVLLTPMQATAVAGTSAKVIPAVPIWVNLDTAASDTFVRATAAANYTTDAGVKNKYVIFMVDAAALDTTNGFDCIQIITGASNAANITQAEYIMTGTSYHQATPPSAIID